MYVLLLDWPGSWDTQGRPLGRNTQTELCNPCAWSPQKELYVFLFRVCKNNINDPKDYHMEDICNHFGINGKNKMLFFLWCTVNAEE